MQVSLFLFAHTDTHININSEDKNSLDHENK